MKQLQINQIQRNSFLTVIATILNFENNFGVQFQRKLHKIVKKEKYCFLIKYQNSINNENRFNIQRMLKVLFSSFV